MQKHKDSLHSNKYHFKNNKEKAKKISPFSLLNAKMPPTIIFHGEKDQLISYGTVIEFTEKAKELVTSSCLRKKYVEQFLHGRQYGTLRAITVDVKKETDLVSTKKLIKIKERLK